VVKHEKPIYLDYAAATPLDPEVLQAMLPYFSERFYNPSANYGLSKEVRRDLNQARSKIAFWLGAQANEIIFTAGGTEANNLAISGVMNRYPDAKLLVSAGEHESVLQPASNYSAKTIPINSDGRLAVDALAALIDDRTVLISVAYANNEIGTIQPLRQASRLIESVRVDRRRRQLNLPLYLHSDACQAGNFLDLHVKRLGVDLLTLNGGKIYGPKQSGLLYVSRQIQLTPQIYGGGQERNLRSGTENVAADIGLAVALDMAQTDRDQYSLKLSRLRDYFIAGLKKQFPGAQINGSLKYRLPNNVHVTFPGQDNEVLLIGLDQAGVMAAAGSACSASKEEPSHVLTALGLSKEQARSSLRFSLGKDNTQADIVKTLSVLRGLVC
jgi:cysteine desulfurase